jgi:hypothetical protein
VSAARGVAAASVVVTGWLPQAPETIVATESAVGAFFFFVTGALASTALTESLQAA